MPVGGGKQFTRLDAERGLAALGAQSVFVFALAFVFFGGLAFLAFPPRDKPWEALTGLSTWASVLALLAAAWLALRQLSQLRATYQVDAFIRAADSVDSLEFRTALQELVAREPMLHDPDSLREYYYSLDENERARFENLPLLVGNALERIGALIEYGALDRNLILEYMGQTILIADTALEFMRRPDGWVFLPRLAHEAASYLAKVEKSQPQPRFVDAVSTSDLSLSVRVDPVKGAILPYRADAGEQVYRIAAYVRNNTKSRIRAYAEVTLLAAPPYRPFALVTKKSGTGASLDEAARSTGLSETSDVTLSVAAGGRQGIPEFTVAGPGGASHQSAWEITTKGHDPKTYRGVIELVFAG